MINPLQLSLTQDDGTKRNIIIEPVLTKNDTGLHNTGTYRLYKDAFGDESALFTEPLETDKPNNDLSDTMNPDYLGTLIIDTQGNWAYNGDLLSPGEQEQAARYIAIIEY